MAVQANLNGIPRFGYVVAGLGMMGWGFYYAGPGLGHYAWPIVGAVVLINGIIGFCPVVHMLGLGGKQT